MPEKPPRPEDIKRKADAAEARSTGQTVEAPSEVTRDAMERLIKNEETHLERTARRLATSIETLDRVGTDKASEDLSNILTKIDNKYRHAVQWLDLTGGLIGSGVLSFALQLDPQHMTMAQNIDWGDLAQKEGVVLAIYALARCASLALKWKREANVGKTVIAELNK